MNLLDKNKEYKESLKLKIFSITLILVLPLTAQQKIKENIFYYTTLNEFHDLSITGNGKA